MRNLIVTVFFALQLCVALDAKVPMQYLLADNAASPEVLAGPELYLYEASIAPPEPPAPNDNILRDKSKIRIINLGRVINHAGLDYAPTVTADGKTLYYVSDRRGSKLKPSKDPSHDFWAAKKLSNEDTVFFQPFNIDTSKASQANNTVNTQLNEGVASISADGQTLVFTGCNRPDGLGKCDLYIVELNGEEWGKPVNLGKNVNSEFWDSQPSISPNKSRIYFVSNRPGPFGSGDDNFDIWYTDRDDETETWKPAKNLGAPINTPGKEWSPFIAADGATLFFASDGHKGSLGGLDFYMSTLDEGNGKFSTPENLGAPINTPANEEFITLSASGSVMYFSSDRTDIPGFQGDLDIFMVFVPSFFRATILKVVVEDECTSANIPSVVTIKNLTVPGKILRDTLNTSTKTVAQLVIDNSYYGNPKDSIKSIEMEIVATNPTYGEKRKTITIEKPTTTKDKAEADRKVEIDEKIYLGQKPVIGAEMDFADFVKRNMKKDPTIGQFKGLVMEEVATWTLYPLLNYIFFDENQSTFPPRYVLFNSPDQTRNFSDERIPGKTLDKYYQILNIYGHRLNKYPNVKVTITGCLDNQAEKSLELSKARANVVYQYLKNVWGISDARMKVENRALPAKPSITGDPDKVSKSLSVLENRRTELTFQGEPEDVWNVMKPILDKDPKTFPSPEVMTYTLNNGIEQELVASREIVITRGDKPWKVIKTAGTSEKTQEWDWKEEKGDELSETISDESAFKAVLVVTSKNGQQCKSDPVPIKVMRVKRDERQINFDQGKTREQYDLILFPFDSYEAGAFNDRVMKEFVYPRVAPKSEIKIEGHTDIVGMYEYNKKLSLNRAKTVDTGIKNASRSQFQSLDFGGLGEDEPLYDNQIPEGRFYNRTVRIYIQTPIEEGSN